MTSLKPARTPSLLPNPRRPKPDCQRSTAMQMMTKWKAITKATKRAKEVSTHGETRDYPYRCSRLERAFASQALRLESVRPRSLAKTPLVPAADLTSNHCWVPSRWAFQARQHRDRTRPPVIRRSARYLVKPPSPFLPEQHDSSHPLRPTRPRHSMRAVLLSRHRVRNRKTGYPPRNADRMSNERPLRPLTRPRARLLNLAPHSAGEASLLRLANR